MQKPRQKAEHLDVRGGLRVHPRVRDLHRHGLDGAVGEELGAVNLCHK